VKAARRLVLVVVVIAAATIGIVHWTRRPSVYQQCVNGLVAEGAAMTSGDNLPPPACLHLKQSQLQPAMYQALYDYEQH
jgi:hypothetical protein